ncbi:hypothetical protein LY76DRAFT_529276, partial [Colletotrichum caudatum]
RDDFSNSVHLAAMNGHNRILSRLLVSAVGALDSRDKEEHTPLIWGCMEGHGQTVQMLLDKGADVDAQGSSYSNYYGNALYAASSKGHDNIA